MNFQVISALVLRHLFLYTRNWIRLIELLFWPVVDLCVWGFLTVYLQKHSDIPDFITFLIGAMILWDVLFRSQQAVAISFLEDVWTRNLLNIFAAPVRTYEYLIATFILGVIRIAITALILTVLAKTLYSFDLLRLEWALIPLFANLLIFGWALGLVSTALILRWGQAAESLAWAVPFFIQPISAVFYPVGELPFWLQQIALGLPSTHVFEGMREVLANGGFPWEHMAIASGLNVLFLGAGFGFFFFILTRARDRGLLSKFASE